MAPAPLPSSGAPATREHAGHDHAGHDHAGHDHAGHDHGGHPGLSAVHALPDAEAAYAGYFTGGYAVAGAGAGDAGLPVTVAPQYDRFSRFVLRVYARAPRWAGPLAVLGCFAGSAALVLWEHPTRADAFGTTTCLVKLTTGFDCPGCGGTRAFWYLLHGDLAGAARSHLIAVFAAPFLVYMYVSWVANTVFHRKWPVLRPSSRALTIFLAAWGVFSVVRNLPWAPFNWFYV